MGTLNWAVVNVLGQIWMPNVEASMTYNPGHHDVPNMRDGDGKITRESFSLWLDAHSGDFQTVDDFEATIWDQDNKKSYVFPWESEESEMRYTDSLFPEEIE